MLADPLETSPRQAAEALGDVARLRRRTRRAPGAPWFPLLCFGAVTMLSAPLVVAAGPGVLGPLWLVAGGAGMLLTRRHYRRRGRERGVTGNGRPPWTIAVVMFAGCLAAGAAGGVLGPIIVVVAGYLALGWLQRDPLPSLAIAPGAALAAAFALAGQAPWIVELTFGAGLVAAGAGLAAADGLRPARTPS